MKGLLLRIVLRKLLIHSPTPFLIHLSVYCGHTQTPGTDDNLAGQSVETYETSPTNETSVAEGPQKGVKISLSQSILEHIKVSAM